MGHHIDDEGRFQSDRYPELPPDKIVLSFKDPEALRALEVFAAISKDVDLAEDVATRIATIRREVDYGLNSGDGYIGGGKRGHV